MFEVQNGYDSDGIRVAQTVDGRETRFLVDANRAHAQVLEEYGAGRHQRGLLRPWVRPDLPESPGRWNVFLSRRWPGKHTRALTDISANVTDRYTYDAFGRLIGRWGTTGNRYRFAGEQFDESLELTYLRARYLDHDTGRFYAVDPLQGDLRSPVSLHRFLYAANNPANFIDPSGESYGIASLMLGVVVLGVLATSACSSQYVEQYNELQMPIDVKVYQGNRDFGREGSQGLELSQVRRAMRLAKTLMHARFKIMLDWGSIQETTTEMVNPTGFFWDRIGATEYGEADLYFVKAWDPAWQPVDRHGRPIDPNRIKGMTEKNVAIVREAGIRPDAFLAHKVVAHELAHTLGLDDSRQSGELMAYDQGTEVPREHRLERAGLWRGAWSFSIAEEWHIYCRKADKWQRRQLRTINRPDTPCRLSTGTPLPPDSSGGVGAHLNHFS